MSFATGSLWSRIAELPLQVDSYHLVGLELATNSGFVRQTTEVCLTGAGHQGRGEDVVWAGGLQDKFQARGGHLDLAGTFTMAEFSARLGRLELAPDPMPDSAWRGYRRWAFESAALDLALRQSGMGIERAAGKVAAPMHFGVSLGLSHFDAIEQRLAIHPAMRFKLDATSDWTPELCAQLAALGTVDVVDFKGAYSGTPVDVAVDLDLYRRVLDAMPNVIVEDPHDDGDVIALLKARDSRIAWDAPIHSMADVDAMPLAADALNIKPSRFGTLELLSAAYESCAQRGLPAYGGGQFELGVGRRQIQLLAALFHPRGANDVASRGYHDLASAEPRPASPMLIQPAAAGFDFVG